MPEWIRSIAAFFQVEATVLVRYGARILAIWALAWLAARIINLIARRIEAAVDDGNDLITTSREKRGRTISQLLRGVGRIISFSIAILLTIDVFMDIGPILAGFGILGLAVSFGAQSLVKDIISGFFILLEDQFAVGDVIGVAGTSGVVEKMTLRVVVLRDMKGTVHVVPNSEIKVVSNMTRGWSRAVIDVAVAYDTDLDRALAVVRDEASVFSNDPAWKPQLDEPLEVPGVESLGESGVVVRVLARTQPGQQWAVAREFRRRIKMRLDRESIEIPFPQRRVHVTVDGSADEETIRAAGAAGGGCMTLRLFNTMTRSVDAFQPLRPGRVSLYTCGPTVYNFAHIGNFRTFLFEDLLRRWLEASGFDVFHVMNLTDVDDKVIKGATEAGEPVGSYVERYIEAFHEDRRYLRIRDAAEYPRATRYIEAMIALVQSLLDKGIAYRSDDGSVYFAIGRFPAYGRLSRLDTRQLKTGASERVSADEYTKEDARDFVLWKASRPEDEAVGAAWDAPFGRGRPGWHLECSAMALDLLSRHWGTDVLDIHAGGVDLIFPHHEDEIAQSCAHTGQPDFARVWMHGEFMTLSGTKMSKRFGNFLTARDLREEGVDPGAVRLLIFNTHYRQPLDWSDESLGHAREGSRRLGELRDRLRERAAVGGADDRAYLPVVETFHRDFSAALDDDLNSPRGLAALFVFAREANRLMDEGKAPGRESLGVLDLADRVLDVMPTRSARVEVGGVAGDGAVGPAAPEVSEAPPVDANAADRWAVAWKQRRDRAKAARDYAEADRIRELLRRHGYEIRDSRAGSEVVRTR